MPSLPLSDADLVRVARALADPTRLRILRTIASSNSLCCGAIGREVPVRPATVSHHLRVLADAGLVDTERAGQFIHVRMKAGRLDEFRRGLAALGRGGAGLASRSRAGASAKVGRNGGRRRG